MELWPWTTFSSIITALCAHFDTTMKTGVSEVVVKGMWCCSYQRKALNIKAVWMSSRCRGWYGEMLSSQSLYSPLSSSQHVSVYLVVLFSYSSPDEPSAFYRVHVCGVERHNKHLTRQHLLLRLTGAIKSSHFTVDAHTDAVNFVNSNRSVYHKWQQKGADINGGLGDSSAFRSLTRSWSVCSSSRYMIPQNS